MTPKVKDLFEHLLNKVEEIIETFNQHAHEGDVEANYNYGYREGSQKVVTGGPQEQYGRHRSLTISDNLNP